MTIKKYFLKKRILENQISDDGKKYFKVKLYSSFLTIRLPRNSEKITV